MLNTSFLKYAFPVNASGEIKIAFFVSNYYDDNLLIQNNVSGFSADLNLEKFKSLGLKLARSLVR